MQSKQSQDFLKSPSSLEFLDGPQKDEVAQSEREFAQLYVETFVNTPSGRALLAHWEKTIFWKPTPVSASVQQYAADEALRNFIRGIRGQIEQVAQARQAR
jgi:hypothetical protein